MDHEMIAIQPNALGAGYLRQRSQAVAQTATHATQRPLARHSTRSIRKGFGKRRMGPSSQMSQAKAVAT